MAVSKAKSMAQQTFAKSSWSVLSRIRRRYGLRFAASALWKSASRDRRSVASKVNAVVSGDLIIWGQNIIITEWSEPKSAPKL